MLTSFYTALTGLSGNSTAINTIGNNLANINTTGFKGSRTTFSELLGTLTYGRSGNGNPIQVGGGLSSPGVTQLFTQGSIQTTGRSTDAAVSGNGYFVVNTGGGFGFTRAGNFSFNKSGELVNSEGYKVLGYPATAGKVNTGTAPGTIVIQKGSTLPPSATTQLSLNANLDSQAATNSTFTSSVQVYDSLGTAHTVTFNFTKTGATGWSWTATIPAVDTGGAATAAPVQIGTGTLTFNSSGVLTAPTTNPTLSITGLASGAANMSISFDLLDSAGAPRLTSYASASSVSSTSQDGFTSSVLKDILIDSDGVISGLYENGQTKPLAQFALATFNNEEGLLKFSGSTFVKSTMSGEASVGIPGSGGRGIIKGSSLEASNVDIAQEFTDMIIAQRGYQANSRVLNVTDELYLEALNLKR